MFGKMPKSGLIVIIPLIGTLIIPGQYPLLSDLECSQGTPVEATGWLGHNILCSYGKSFIIPNPIADFPCYLFSIKLLKHLRLSVQCKWNGPTVDLVTHFLSVI